MEYKKLYDKYLDVYGRKKIMKIFIEMDLDLFEEKHIDIETLKWMKTIADIQKQKLKYSNEFLENILYGKKPATEKLEIFDWLDLNGITYKFFDATEYKFKRDLRKELLIDKYNERNHVMKSLNLI
jgi:hypothetical protein